MKLFILSVEAKGVDIEESPLANWDHEHLILLYNDARSNWSKYEESQFYIEKLDEIFSEYLTG